MAAVFSAQLPLSVLGVLSSRSFAGAAVLLAALALLSAAFCIDAARGVIPTVIPVALSALSLAAALFACGPLPGERLFGFCFGFGGSRGAVRRKRGHQGDDGRKNSQLATGMKGRSCGYVGEGTPDGALGGRAPCPVEQREEAPVLSGVAPVQLVEELGQHDDGL